MEEKSWYEQCCEEFGVSPDPYVDGEVYGYGDTYDESLYYEEIEDNSASTQIDF